MRSIGDRNSEQHETRTRFQSLRKRYRSGVHYLGGLIMFLIGIQILTGCLLVLYYRPSVRDAHDSVAGIMTDIPFGWIVRSLHHTSANLLVLMLALHALTVLLSKTFRGKRAPTYFTGLLLLLLTLFMCFSGYLLPWDVLSVAAIAVGTGLPREIPLIGPFITELLRGDVAVGSATLSRFFAFHICVTPLALSIALSLHLVFIKKLGFYSPPGTDKKRIPYFPDFMLRQSTVWLLIFAFLVTWAILSPVGLRAEGDPLAPAPEGIRPEWYFLAAYEALKLGGNLTFLSFIGVTAELLTLILFGIVGTVFALMPVLDRKGRGRVWTAFVLFTTGLFITLTLIAISRPDPQIDAAAGVAERVADFRIRTVGYLAPFWLSVVAVTWFLGSSIRLRDRITAFKMPGAFQEEDQDAALSAEDE